MSDLHAKEMQKIASKAGISSLVWIFFFFSADAGLKSFENFKEQMPRILSEIFTSSKGEI